MLYKLPYLSLSCCHILFSGGGRFFLRAVYRRFFLNVEFSVVRVVKVRELGAGVAPSLA